MSVRVPHDDGPVMLRRVRPRCNLATFLRRRVSIDPMARFDRLPPELRLWLHEAALPWSPESALRLWRKALAQRPCPRHAQACLCAAEARMLARDARRVWGPAHPGPGSTPVPEAGRGNAGPPGAPRPRGRRQRQPG